MEIRTYKIEDAAGVLQFRAVVRGAAAGGVKKPSAEGEGKFVGVTREAQATQNKNVPVQTTGIATCVAAAAISYGDAVYIGDNTGKVKSCQTALAAVLVNPAANLYVIGYAETAAADDGDHIKVSLQPFAATRAVS